MSLFFFSCWSLWQSVSAFFGARLNFSGARNLQHNKIGSDSVSALLCVSTYRHLHSVIFTSKSLQVAFIFPPSHVYKLHFFTTASCRLQWSHSRTPPLASPSVFVTRPLNFASRYVWTEYIHEKEYRFISFIHQNPPQSCSVSSV